MSADKKTSNRGVLRAIGSPQERFGEDKLRMLRAVRFASAFGFKMDEQTLAAIGQMADQITVVSVERIAAEARRMLTAPGRVMAVRLLLETGLARAVLPEIVREDQPERIERVSALLQRLHAPTFPLALGVLVA